MSSPGPAAILSVSDVRRKPATRDSLTPAPGQHGEPTGLAGARYTFRCPCAPAGGIGVQLHSRECAGREDIDVKATALAAVIACGLAGTAHSQDTAGDPATLYDGWKVLRQFDCQRCHGATYEGSVGPSLVRSASDRSEEDFTQLLLEGNAERGMPAFKDVGPVAEKAPAIYAYFKARADGRIGAGKLTPSGEETTTDSGE